MKPDQATLLLYEAGALDPAEAARVEAWLARHPEGRLSLGEVDTEGDAWRLPPPGLGLGVRAGLPAVMSPPRLRPGDRHQLLLAPRADAGQRLVVLLRRLAGAWRVEAPTSPDDRLTLDRLPVEADGRHRVDLLVRGPAGPQRLAVALPPVALPVVWAAQDETRWAALLAGMADGSVPVGVVEIVVG